MARDVEPREAELAHHRDLIAREGAHRVGRVVGRGRWHAAVAVPAQIGGDDGEVAGEGRDDFVPHEMGLRDPVQQQERRAAAAVPDVDRRLAGIDRREREPFEHRASFPSRSAKDTREGTGQETQRHREGREILIDGVAAAFVCRLAQQLYRHDPPSNRAFSPSFSVSLCLLFRALVPYRSGAARP